MGYMTNGLTLAALRGANRARLPEFKNKHGGPAHSKADGSDWTPAQWLGATLGELGEFARARLDFDRGLISFEEYRQRAAKELADVQTYLDLLAQRALDIVEGDCDLRLLEVLAGLGEFANDRKKLDRGDLNPGDDAAIRLRLLDAVRAPFADLCTRPYLPAGTPPATIAHPDGVDLGRATIDKFNEVSERVNSRVRLEADDWHFAREGGGNG